ncbi:TetR/AcrR family transcriptional regulator C-terminal domain-containing protein [Fundicoccus culcitae]|uniref:TetR/AcrR family transcriptional regulator C-terminal domain-containing protein n=1 Tax=Fundicoccus culcitae TaxID=2969821 RepID=A0ABY5P515_9LACT|nr:TetR/AcrR family transcriptional regulator C-terminal domain-containing protein [Fundicoccus culcitae]UUX33700.1 TetR/AcrR family transcriptional regulator C-terminal domain-containing protein [Fundicoccus culcitae]
MSEEHKSTQDLLVDSFKSLLLEKPFEKINIKQITDKAGVIRPTFYNHFRDKNEVFEYILDEELFDPLQQLLEIGMVDAGLSMLFIYFEKNRAFYAKAFETTGQNSFSDVLSEKLQTFFMANMKDYSLREIEDVSILTMENIARYYAYSTALIIELWITNPDTKGKDVNEVVTSYKYLMTHSIFDIIEKK